jgi:hypothetical protein
MPITDSPLSERITQAELANSNGALFADAYHKYSDSKTSRSEEFFLGGGGRYRDANEEEQKDSTIFPKVDMRELQELTRKARDEQDVYFKNLEAKARQEERDSNDDRLLQLPHLAIESANEGKYSVDVLCLKQSPSGSGNTVTTSSDRSEISLTEEEKRISKAIEGMGFKTSIATGYDDTVESIDNPSSPPSGKKSCLVIRAEW